MGKKLYENLRAESEADEVGARFMDSADVVGDMSRAFGHDFSGVNIHADSVGASRVAGTGVDAIAEGSDIYFGSGVYQKGDPASNGLLAHELTHTMQQGVGGGAGAEVSSPMGAAQGGMKDWFRKIFSRKKMEISEPTLIQGPDTENIKITERVGSADRKRNFMDGRSYGLYQMLQNATPEQMQDPMLRELVVDDYNKNMNKRLMAEQERGVSKEEMDSHAFRGGAGELANLNMLIDSVLPDHDNFKDVMKYYGDPHGKKLGNVEGALNGISSMLESNQALGEIMGGISGSFEGIDYYKTGEARSDKMMNNLMLRSIVGKLGDERGSKIESSRADYLREHKDATKDELNQAGLAGAEKETELFFQGNQMQKEVNTGTSAAAERFRNMFANRMRGRGRRNRRMQFV